MPNHKTHEVAGIITTPLVFAGSIYYTGNMDTALVLSAAYVFSTYYLSPDLDIDSAPYHRWHFLMPLWYPYKTIIKHRSWLSHSGPISATIRFGYMALLALLVAWVFNYPLTFTPWYVILLVGMILADTLHTLLDVVWKG